MLSCNIFIPGARLNYCVFLININYISYYAASSHVAQYYTPLSQCQYVFGVILMVYVLALVTSVAVEVPCDNLQRLVFRHSKIFIYFFFKYLCNDFYTVCIIDREIDCQ